MKEKLESDILTTEEIDVNPYFNKDRRLVTQPYDMSVDTLRKCSFDRTGNKELYI